MRLISIGNPNILINPELITCVEQEVVGISTITYVYVGDKKFVLGIPLKDFWLSLGVNSPKSTDQYFGG